MIDENLTGRWHKSDIVLLAGSAGAFRLIYKAIEYLPANQGKTFIIILHRKKNFDSDIEYLFGEHTSMKLKEVTDKEPMKKNTVYIAPSNYHTLIEKKGYFSLDVSDEVWYSKPSIDVTFESAADAFGDRCTVILFSGANQDGARGMLKLRNCGALTIVQDPEAAEVAEMPQAALNLDAPEYILSSEEIFTLFVTT